MVSEPSIANDSNCCFCLTLSLLRLVVFAQLYILIQYTKWEWTMAKYSVFRVSWFTKIFILFIQNKDLEIFAHRSVIWSSKERYSSNKTPKSLKFLVSPSLWILSTGWIKSWFTGIPISLPLFFCFVNCHLDRPEPVGNFLQFLIHYSLWARVDFSPCLDLYPMF